MLLSGGKAEEEGGRAEEVRKYLLPRLECAPDLHSIGVGRRRLSGCSGGRRALAEAGTFSG